MSSIASCKGVNIAKRAGARSIALIQDTNEPSLRAFGKSGSIASGAFSVPGAVTQCLIIIVGKTKWR